MAVVPLESIIRRSMRDPHIKREEVIVGQSEGNSILYEFSYEDDDPDIDEIYERERDDRT